MSTAADRMELVREAVFSVVGQHFPEECRALPAIWSWWVRGTEPTRPRDGLPATGLAATGAAGDESYTAVLLLAFSAIICEWPKGEVKPTNRHVAEAIAAAAPRLGLRGERLRRVIDASTAKLCEVLGRLDSPSVPRKPVLAPPDALWVEELRTGIRVSPYEISAARHADLIAAEDVDLLIDEFGRRFKGISGWAPFSTFTPRALVSLWLALEYTGRSFGYDEIDAVRWSYGQDDAGRRKYATLVRETLLTLVGSEVVPRGRQSRYEVPLDGWSWRWVRLSPDPRASRLRG